MFLVIKKGSRTVQQVCNHRGEKRAPANLFTTNWRCMQTERSVSGISTVTLCTSHDTYWVSQWQHLFISNNTICGSSLDWGEKSNQPSLKYQKHQSNETNTPLKSLCFLKYSPKHKLSNFRKCLISAQHHHQASENSLSSNSSAWKHPSRLLMFFTAPSS